MAALIFVVDTVLTLFVVAFLLRALMPVVRADFRNPVGHAILQLTNPLVIPLRRLLPPAGRFDVASLVALLLVQAAKAALLFGLRGGGMPAAVVAAWGLRDLASTVLQFYFWVLLIYVLLSWFAPQERNPGARLVAALCQPLLEPVRRVLPPLGAFDLSPLVVMIGLQALQILLR